VKLNFEPKILSQHIDTLKTSHKSTCESDFNGKFQNFCNLLDDLKFEAQNVKGFNNKDRFVVSELLGLGKFRVHAQGSQAYKYIVSNDDIKVQIGNIKFGSDRPQILIHYSQSFLFTVGHKKAYLMGKKFVEKALGSTYDNVTEIHLACDIWGISYEFDDFHRFQTNFKKTEIATSDADLVQFVGKRRLETISFGKGAFMFRIYDKLAQLRSYPEKKALILTKWILNGYEPDSKARIFRHEIQLRDEHLKKHIPLDTSDRVGHIFANLSGLWAYALQKVQFVNLNSSELERVKNYENSETIRKIFHRAKTDKKRFHFWDVLGYWDNVLVSQTLTYKAYKESKKKTAEKAVKTFVSTTYKSFGAEPDMLKEVFEIANSELLKYRGLTLHQYAQLKVVDSFVQNESLVINHGIVPPDIHEKSFIEAHRAYFSVLDTVPEIIRQDVRNKRFENYTNRRLALEAESVF